MEPRILPAGVVSGVVFRDYDADGRQDALEPGVGGVTVSAFDASENLLATATTGSDPASWGRYALAIPGPASAVKVEFTGLPRGWSAGPSGPDSRSEVQYVGTAGGPATASLGVIRPGQYTPGNPGIAVARFFAGNPLDAANRDRPAVASYTYAAPGGPATTLATAGQVGSVYGLAYRAASGIVYASAFQKFGAGFGPAGPGAIYAIDGQGRGYASRYVDLNAVFGAGTAGSDPHTNPDYLRDTAESYRAAGKSSLGGLAIAEDGSTLYAMNLADRRLYAIQTYNPSTYTITRHDIPIPADASSPGDIRPFAVTVHDGLVYVGMVDSAEASGRASDLKAYVYAFDPASKTFGASPVLQFSLDYPRGGSDAWRPWIVTYAGTESWPQPVLAGIAFDNGSMVLGMRDRYGDQVGAGTLNPFDPAGTATLTARPAGEVLRASAVAGGGWTIESDATATGPLGPAVTTAGAGTGRGPGGGLFYFDQDAARLGGVLQLPGLPEVLATAAGGTRLLGNLTGSSAQGFRFDPDPAGGPGFGGANGIGGLAALNPVAPMEIGGRVFRDVRVDGIKSADEPGTPGLVVRLYRYATLIGTTRTGADGVYRFDSSNVPDGFGDQVPYEIRIGDEVDYARGGILDGAGPTIRAQDARGLSGSKARYGLRLPLAVRMGQSDHTNYLGYFQAGSLSGVLFDDENDDGIKGAEDAGLAYVTVTLDDGIHPPITTATGTDGSYRFEDLPPGTYRISTEFSMDYPDRRKPGRITVGTQGGRVVSQSSVEVTIAEGDIGAGYNFARVRAATVNGSVYFDANANGVMDPGDPRIAGATITLTRFDDFGNVLDTRTMTSYEGGFFHFWDVTPGHYTFSEEPPAGYLPGVVTPGYWGGTPGVRSISGIRLRPGAASWNYHFGERLPQLGGVTYLDANRNGVRDPGEAPLGGVEIRLIGPGGYLAGSTTSDVQGSYTLPYAFAGVYTAVATPPDGYGTSTPVAVAADLTTLAPAPVDFGLTTSALRGTAYVDRDNDGRLGAGEAGLGGVPVTLAGTDFAGREVLRDAVTEADGSYAFADLLPGVYRLIGRAPAGYLPGTDAAGLDRIELGAGVDKAGNDFALLEPANLSGAVYVDRNADGRRNAGDTPIAGVAVTLTGIDDRGSPVGRSATTDGAGIYLFADLRPGTYAVAASAPAGSAPGSATPGATGGTPGTRTLAAIPLPPGAASWGNDFGEFPPRTIGEVAGPAGGRLDGVVYDDGNGNGSRDAGEPGVPGVAVTLAGTDAAGAPVTLTATTDAAGAYDFPALPPGTYAITRSMPSGWLAGRASAGTVLVSDAAASGPDFGLIRPASLGGSAYLDANRNGARGRNEFGLARVAVTLAGADNLGNPVARTTTTAADGSYRFDDLRPGVYAVTLTPAPAFRAGRAVAGTAGGQAGRPAAIGSIALGGGAHSAGYDFAAPVPAGSRLGSAAMRRLLRVGPANESARAAAFARLARTIPRLRHHVPTLAERLARPR